LEENLKLPSKSLEPLILNYCVKNPSFFMKIKPYLKTDNRKSYFSDKKYQEIFNYYSAYFDKFDLSPKRKTMKAIVAKRYEQDEELQLYFNTIIDDMYEDKEEYNEEYIEEEIKNFIKENKVYEAWLQGQNDIEEGKYGSLLNKFEEAVRINFDKDLGTSIKEIDQMYDNIIDLMDEEVIDTGYDNLNAVLDKGFHNREIYILAAIPGGFKCLRNDVKVKVRYKIDEETGNII
jgi:replicative DNA helicase